MAELTEEVKKSLKVVADHFNGEDTAARQRQIKTWRRLKFLWDNLQNVYYSEVAHDWRLPESDRLDDQDYYDKPINVFRAYLESIIAALSITVPPVTCYPDDADNNLDVTTAKAGDKIAALLFKHNEANLMWLHSLFIYCTEGMTACYCYPKADKKFGTTEEPVTEDVEEEVVKYNCSICGGELPDAQSAELPVPCEQCQQEVIPEPTVTTETKQVVKEIKHVPKTRIVMDVYGGLYIKVPIYARKQEDCPYLTWSYETHYSNVLERYSHLKDKVGTGGQNNGTFDQWGRLSPQYRGEYPTHNVTVNNTWLRPSAFNVLAEEECAKLKKLYPDGVKVVIVNDTVADAEPENLDDVWILTYNPLSDYIHFDPLGLLLTSIQEITNDLISLVLQTVEHGIPQTFATPAVLDFQAYQRQEIVPGGIVQAKSPGGGKALADGFFESRTATLSGEVLPFANKVQELGQMVSGALPSLFGGQVSGSRTASEYSMSRAQALQRLQNTWKTLTSWWKNIFSVAIPMFIKEVKEDKDVTKNEFGSFINVFIRKSDLEGNIGKIELEANENLPLTWSQQKDAIMQLLEMNNEKILETLGSPENLPYLRKAIGLTDYVIPGEDDRNKQYEEIIELINSEAFTMPGEMDPMGQPMPETEIPSVEIEADVDDHNIHIEVCRKWLVSDIGRFNKTENPTGYKNVLLHMKMHKDYIMQQMMAQQMQMSGAPSGEPTGEEAPPIEGVNNGPTTES